MPLNQVPLTSRYAFENFRLLHYRMLDCMGGHPRLEHCLRLPPCPVHPNALYLAYMADTLTSVQGKYKYNAWKKIVDEKVTPETAQTKYVDLVEKLKKSYGFEG